MTNPLRDKDPSKIHLITLRTHDAALWMKPCPEVEQILGGILARYQEMYSIILYCYSFVSNHYHLLLQAPLGNIDIFEENLNREISRRMNRFNLRRGKFWAKRYDDLIVPTEEDSLEGFLYIITNSTKHALVDDPRTWPGLNCLLHFESGEQRKYKFTHYSKRNRKGIPLQTEHTLTLSPLPQYADMDPRARTALLVTKIQERIDLLRQKHKEDGIRFLGLVRLKQEKAGSIPRNVAYARRPICYTKNPQVRREFRRLEHDRRSRFAEASYRFRLGDLQVQFPAHCHKPPLHRVPRTPMGTGLAFFGT
ncbi:MAG: hypothetical protein J0M12_01135 [Deltaproteobacteria bacterium]|nr:hypothetical protein [Deltaproteobacteria bacterium]